jgi:hypothetical protein
MIDNTVTKKKQRAILDEHIATYLANGGKITVFPSQTFGTGYNDTVISRKVDEHVVPISLFHKNKVEEHE